jgi:hypothetical protein
MIGKIAQFLQKVAKKVAEPKSATTFASKINLKVQRISSKSLMKPKNALNKSCFETAYLNELTITPNLGLY